MQSAQVISPHKSWIASHKIRNHHVVSEGPKIIRGVNFGLSSSTSQAVVQRVDMRIQHRRKLSKNLTGKEGLNHGLAVGMVNGLVETSEERVEETIVVFAFFQVRPAMMLQTPFVVDKMKLVRTNPDNVT